MHRRGGDAREVQEIVDKLGHPPRSTSYLLQVIAAFLANGGSVSLRQKKREAINALQRAAQVMRYRIRKRFQLAIGNHQLLRPLRDALLQFTMGLQKRPVTRPNLLKHV